jgi:hypothetical protein
VSDPNALSVPDPGWYPDRSDPTILRWWDGGQWTDNTHSIAPEAVNVEQPVDISAFGLTPASEASAPAAAVVTPAIATPEPAIIVPAAAPEFFTAAEPEQVVAEPVAETPAAPVIPPGWYPDYHDATIQRWWDGRGWTAHTAPLAGAAAPEAAGTAGVVAEPAVAVAVAAAPAAAPSAANRVAPVAGEKNTIATRALIMSIISLFINPLFVFSILGLVFGIRGLRRAPQFPPELGRRGFAIAAIIISVIGVLLAILSVVSAIVVYNQTHSLDIGGGSISVNA